MMKTFRCVVCKTQITYYGLPLPENFNYKCGGKSECIDNIIEEQDKIERRKDLEKYF